MALNAARKIVARTIEREREREREKNVSSPWVQLSLKKSGRITLRLFIGFRITALKVSLAAMHLIERPTSIRPFPRSTIRKIVAREMVHDRRTV